MHDRAGLLPEWAVAELRRPLTTSRASRERIMAGVRAAQPLHPLPARRAPLGSSWPGAMRAGGEAPARPAAERERGFRAYGVALALAASVVAMVATSALLRSDAAPSATLAGAAGGRMIVLGDTVDSALHDTLRLVRFVLDAPAAARVAIAGDFNGWSRTATPLTDSARSGVWSVVVALDRGSRRFAFVVDDTQWVGSTPNDEDASGSAPLRAAPVGGDST